MLCFIGILKCFLVRFIFNARQEKENSLKCSERTETEKNQLNLSLGILSRSVVNT